MVNLKLVFVNINPLNRMIMKKWVFCSVLFVAVMGLTSACDKSDDAPAGKIILSENTVAVHNGGTFDLVFEVSPADLAVTLENIHFDCISSHSSTSGEGAALQNGTAQDDYEIIGLEPWTGDGTASPGKWVVSVKETLATEHISKTVARIRVSRGVWQHFYSGAVTITSVPAMTDDNVGLMVPERLSYMIQIEQTPMNDALAYIDYSDMMLEGESFGVDWITGLQAEILANGSQNCFTVTQPQAGAKNSLYITPVKSAFAALDGSAYPVQAQVRFSVTDATGDVKQIDKDILFYPSTITVPASQTGLEVGENFEVTVPMKDILAKVGLTQEYFERLSGGVGFGISTAYTTEYADGTDDGTGDGIVMGLVFEETLYGEYDIMKTDDFAIDVADYGIPESGTYYGVLTVAVTDPLTMRPLITAIIKLEVVYTR